MARSVHAVYCDFHKQRERRNGDPSQQFIHKAELKPHIERARQLIERDKSGVIKSSLIELQYRLRSYALGVVEEYQKGKPMIRWHVQACDALVKATNDADPIEAALIVGGMYLLRDFDPQRFSSDKGFLYQLVRQYRMQSEMAVGRVYDDREKCVRGYYRVLPMRTTDLIAECLVGAYSRFVGHLLALDRRDRAENERVYQDLARAFAEIGGPPPQEGSG